MPAATPPLQSVISRSLMTLSVIVALSGALILYGVQRNLQTSALIRQLQGGGKQIETTLQHVVDLETGVRGYIITGNEVFLEPYQQGRAALPSDFQALEQFLDTSFSSRGRQEQVTRLNMVRTLLDRWYREVAVPEIQARRENSPVAAEMVATQAGKRLLDGIRGQLGEMRGVLDTQLQAAEREATLSLRLVQGLMLLALLLLVVASGLIGADLSRRLRGALSGLSDVTRRIAAGHYEERAPQMRVHELQELAEHFNLMAAAVQEAQGELRERHAALEEQHARMTRLGGEMGQLAELSDTLQACYTLPEGYAVLQNTLPLLFPGWNGTVSVIAASRNLLNVQVAWGDSLWRTQDVTSTPEMCWALRKGRTYTREHPIVMSCLQQAPGHNHAYICIPLVAHGEAVGTLRLSAKNPEEGAGETAHVRVFAETVARQIALAITNLQLRDTLRNQSIRDALTGAFNRRYLEETLSRELVAAGRNGHSLSVLALDIDHFKRFNDTFGHDGGDAMLIAVAGRMQDHFRAEDVVCRYGGEEFVVVLPGTAEEEAFARADGFREAVRALRVNLRGQPLGQVSVSIGVATFPADGSTPDSLITAADGALYEAKRQGRDRVIRVSQLSTVTGAAGEAPGFS